VKTHAPIINKNTLVMKFGGSSVGTPDAMSRVVSIVKNEKSQWKNVVVVTSALSGVTDTLLKMASQESAADSRALEAMAVELARKHADIARVLVSDPAWPVKR
jgi:aspartokinase